MAQSYSQLKMLQLVCKSLGKWGMMISFSDYVNPEGYLIPAEILEAAPYLDPDSQIVYEGFGYFLFDTEEEMLEYYGQTVGEDGPTKANPYKGGARVFAVTCGPDGQLLTENT